MTKQEFDSLAERVLLTLVAGNPGVFNEVFFAQTAVGVADEFVKALNRRHFDLASTKGLTPEEVLLLHAKPHPHVIECIKSVRDRTNLSLKEAKDLVDKGRAELGLL